MDHVQQGSVDELFAKVQVDISKIEGGLQRLERLTEVEDSMQEDTREAASATLDAPERAIAPEQIQENPEKARHGKERQGRGQQKSLGELLRDLRAPGSEERRPLTAEISNTCDIALALDSSVAVRSTKDGFQWREDQKEAFYMHGENGFTSWYGIFINGVQVGIAKLRGASVFYQQGATYKRPNIEKVVTLPQYHSTVATLARRYVAQGQVEYSSGGNREGLNPLGQRKLKEIYKAQKEVAKARLAQPLVEVLATDPQRQQELSALCQQFTTEVVCPNTYRVFAIPLERESGRPIRARHHFPIGVVEYKDKSNAEVSGYQTLPGFEEDFMSYLSTVNPSNSPDLFKNLHARAEERAQAKRTSLLLKQRRMQQRGQEATL